MDNINRADKDLLEREQEEKALHFNITSAPDSTVGFKEEGLSTSSSSSSFPLLSSLDLEESGRKPPAAELISSNKVLHFMLALIRTQYLQARPPQQIKELKSLLEKIIGSQEGVIITTRTSTGDQEVGVAASVDLSSNRKKCTSCTNTCFTTTAGDAYAEKALGGSSDGMKGDLDEVGNKIEDEKLLTSTANTASCGNAVEKVGTSGIVTAAAACKEEKAVKCASSSIIVSNFQEEIQEVLRGLHDVTLGYNPPPLAAEVPEPLSNFGGDNGKGKVDLQSFLQPPIQYRLAFTKYIIKQLESSNWSAPRGSNEEDVVDPVEQETLLEKWYDSLESLSNKCSRQMLSEPFYRLYEIKMAHHNRKGSGAGRNTSSSSEESTGKQGVVKIFEHETSFVADGTTGLVTWKASTEFLKWLTASSDDGYGKSLLEKLGEGRDVEWVLELGCGCGFLAVAICKSIPVILQQYIATDGSLSVLEKAKLNVEANFSEKDNHENLVKSRIRFEKVDWQNEETRESFTQLVDGMTCINGADKGLLLGADIVFDPEIIPDLLALIADFLEARAGIAILACTIRNEATMHILKQQIESHRMLARICGRWEDGEILEIKLPS